MFDRDSNNGVPSVEGVQMPVDRKGMTGGSFSPSLGCPVNTHSRSNVSPCPLLRKATVMQPSLLLSRTHSLFPKWEQAKVSRVTGVDRVHEFLGDAGCSSSSTIDIL